MSVRKKYILLQGTFWILFCISGCFVSLLLQEIGVDNRGIGMVTAGFGLISALLQPIIGRFCDRSSRINWKHMILFIMIPFFVVCVFMLNIQGKFAGIICVGLLLLLGNMILPFVNAAMSYYQAQNIIINYGVASYTVPEMNIIPISEVEYGIFRLAEGAGFGHRGGHYRVAAHQFDGSYGAG